MGNAELKLDIFRIVDQLSERELQKLYGMVSDLISDEDTSSGTLSWNRLSEGERTAIEKGLSQLEQGQGIPHEEVMNGFRKEYS
jgi:predicted transcriptional regulator